MTKAFSRLFFAFWGKNRGVFLHFFFFLGLWLFSGLGPPSFFGMGAKIPPKDLRNVYFLVGAPQQSGGREVFSLLPHFFGRRWDKSKGPT